MAWSTVCLTPGGFDKKCKAWHSPLCRKAKQTVQSPRRVEQSSHFHEAPTR
jgi:hypothetical protein